MISTNKALYKGVERNVGALEGRAFNFPEVVPQSWAGKKHSLSLVGEAFGNVGSLVG